MTESVDMPEGTVWRKVRMSETLFRALGARLIEWGEPDSEGFYLPTVFVGPDGMARERWPGEYLERLADD